MNKYINTTYNEFNMNLSYKEIQFIIEAIEYQIQAYQERLNQEDLDEDEASDIMNDSGFLEALCKAFKYAIY